jgi:hypothetical protein
MDRGDSRVFPRPVGAVRWACFARGDACASSVPFRRMILEQASKEEAGNCVFGLVEKGLALQHLNQLETY